MLSWSKLHEGKRGKKVLKIVRNKKGSRNFQNVISENVFKNLFQLTFGRNHKSRVDLSLNSYSSAAALAHACYDEMDGNVMDEVELSTPLDDRSDHQLSGRLSTKGD